MPLPNHCLFRFRIFKHSVFSLSADWSTILCVPSCSFKTGYTHLMSASACIFKKSVILLLSQYCFHWAFAVSVRNIYTWLSAHPFHSCLLSVRGGFFWCIFGVSSSFIRNQFTFRVVLYNPEIGQEPPEVFASVNKLLCIQWNQYNLLLY